MRAIRPTFLAFVRQRCLADQFTLLRLFGRRPYQACNDHCEAAGYSYFGLEFGYQCSCGNSVPVDRLKGEDDLCDLVSGESRAYAVTRVAAMSSGCILRRGGCLSLIGSLTDH